jgi:ORF6N domain-containing protein
MKLKKIIPADIDSLIVDVRGQKVILDAALASIYGVSTKALNQAIKRNAKRFPPDFMFRLIPDEAETAYRSRSQTVTSNRSQFVTGSQKHRDPRFLPYAFTEHGAIMAANVLNTTRAVDMSVFVVRAFLKMRSTLKDTRELAQKLSALEQELKGRLDLHEAAIVDVLQRIMRILEPPAEAPAPGPPQREMGFHIREAAVPYRVRKKFPRL